jgi:hypothetical protein
MPPCPGERDQERERPSRRTAASHTDAVLQRRELSRCLCTGSVGPAHPRGGAGANGQGCGPFGPSPAAESSAWSSRIAGSGAMCSVQSRPFHQRRCSEVLGSMYQPAGVTDAG